VTLQEPNLPQVRDGLLGPQSHLRHRLSLFQAILFHFAWFGKWQPGHRHSKGCYLLRMYL